MHVLMLSFLNRLPEADAGMLRFSAGRSSFVWQIGFNIYDGTPCVKVMWYCCLFFMFIYTLTVVYSDTLADINQGLLVAVAEIWEWNFDVLKHV